MTQTTHALLVTDVVDSTKLAEELGDAKVAELWAAHDRLARDLLATHKGREIDKSDGFLLLFGEAKDAVAYALAYHAALKDLDISARAGLHVGEVVLRENSAADVARGAKPLEVEGLAKPTAARVMSVAQGGQTLATTEAIAALDIARAHHEPDGRVEGEGLLAVTHGHWMLKGVLHPQELFEVGLHGEAPFVPPPDAAKAWRVQWQNEAWVPVKQVKHSLPRERDAFVGREDDLHALAELLEQGAALVSVLGIGGTGKTRLVTHFGWTWLGSFPGGVWFCDLSEARSVDGIAYAVAKALDVALGKDPIPQLGNAIAGRGRCLVILDNFEQVARHAQEALGSWLDRATDAQFVVTTREVLGLRGEKALALAPLPTSDGAKLFVERAQDAKRDFVPDDPASIESLVTLLDGLPLAIELAAARVRVMPPKTLLARMSQRFKLLTSTGGRRDRQATLRGALDWSWDLLSHDEQAALAQVSVFEGGFTLEAAAAVLDLSELWPEDAVQALVDKSLVRTVSDERFDLLVSVQEYAAEKLELVDQREAAALRHGSWCAGLGTDEARRAVWAHGGVARWRALLPELDNLVVATRRAVARDDGEVATGALRAAWTLLGRCGPFAVGLDLATAALQVTTLSTRSQADVAFVLGQALARLGRGAEPRPHFDRALAGYREVGARRSACEVLQFLGILDDTHGQHDEARAHFDAALALAPEAGFPEGNTIASLGILHHGQGRVEEARAHMDRALAAHREVGNRSAEGIVLGNLGIMHMGQGRMEEARVHMEEALAIHREVGNRGMEGSTLGSLGNLYEVQGQMDQARAHYDRALAIHRELGARGAEGIVLGNLGVLHTDEGRMEEAHARLVEALAIHREVGNRTFEGAVLSDLGTLHRLQGHNDEARAAFAAGETLLRELEDAVSLGALLCGRAQLEHTEGHADAARAAYEEAKALAVKVGAGADSSFGKELANTSAALEAEAGPGR